MISAPRSRRVAAVASMVTPSASDTTKENEQLPEHSDEPPPPASSLKESSLLQARFQLQPGRLVNLITKAEAEARLTLVDAHIVQIPAKEANIVRRLIDNALRSQGLPSLQHIRRVVRAESIPWHIQEYLIDEENLTLEQRAKQEKRLYLVAAPTSVVSRETLNTILSTLTNVPPTFIVRIPSTPPVSHRQATEWTAAYWPTVYKAHNPYGPQPAHVARAQATISPYVGTFISLAKQIGEELGEKGYGEGFGAVVVDPNGRGKGAPAVVAIAGDARWVGCEQEKTRIGCRSRIRECGSGNPMVHAAMRAIGLVARQRRDMAANPCPDKECPNPDSSTTLSSQRRPPIPSKQSHDSNHSPHSSSKPFIASASIITEPYLDVPITPTEACIYSDSPLPPGGYLCAGLDIYLSHEPCVMCSMALLHSRFERVVFAARMRGTGALTVERRTAEENPENPDSRKRGYGLFWLPELNWKMMAWRWIEEDEEDDDDEGDEWEEGDENGCDGDQNSDPPAKAINSSPLKQLDANVPLQRGSAADIERRKSRASFNLNLNSSSPSKENKLWTALPDPTSSTDMVTAQEDDYNHCDYDFNNEYEDKHSYNQGDDGEGDGSAAGAGLEAVLQQDVVRRAKAVGVLSEKEKEERRAKATIRKEKRKLREAEEMRLMGVHA